MPTLKHNDLSLEVVRLQIRLDLFPTGYFDERTVKAVKPIQKTHETTRSPSRTDMRLPRLIPVLLLALFAACSDPSPSVAAGDGHGRHAAVSCKESIHPFWAKFRAAVLADDMNALAGMTELPLIVHRSSPAAEKFLSHQDFAKQFPQFLGATPRDRWHGQDSLNPTSMKELMRMYHTLEKGACESEGYLRFDRWTFVLTSGGWFRPDAWRLVSIYVDDFPASMNHIPLQP